MEEVLLDTDALIELHRRPETLSTVLDRYRCLISQITLYEYLFGLAYLGRDLDEEKGALERVYEVVPISQTILRRALMVDLELTRRGERLEFRDLIVGASAIELGVGLVTGNLRHFERMSQFGLGLIPLDEFVRAAGSAGGRRSGR